jgi:hypothetical protein
LVGEERAACRGAPRLPSVAATGAAAPARWAARGACEWAASYGRGRGASLRALGTSGTSGDEVQLRRVPTPTVSSGETAVAALYRERAGQGGSCPRGGVPGPVNAARTEDEPRPARLADAADRPPGRARFVRGGPRGGVREHQGSLGAHGLGKERPRGAARGLERRGVGDGERRLGQARGAALHARSGRGLLPSASV